MREENKQIETDCGIIRVATQILSLDLPHILAASFHIFLLIGLGMHTKCPVMTWGGGWGVNKYIYYTPALIPSFLLQLKSDFWPRFPQLIVAFNSRSGIGL